MVYSRKAHIFITLRGTLLAAAGALYVAGFGIIRQHKAIKTTGEAYAQDGIDGISYVCDLKSAGKELM